MQAEKIEHERRVDELAALTNNPDTLFPKHVMAASQVKSTQDRGVQGPTRHLGIEQMRWNLTPGTIPDDHLYFGEEDGFRGADQVDEGDFYIKRTVAPGWDRCANRQLLQMVKGTKAQKTLQRAWVKRMKNDRVPVTKGVARMAAKFATTLSQFGPTFGSKVEDDSTCSPSTDTTPDYRTPPGACAILVGAVVLLISDGLDRDAPGDLAREMERLHLSARRLIWVNPLLRWEGFAPKARGIAAMLPHVDAFRAGHSIATLEQLAQAISAPDDAGEKARLMAAI